MGHLEVPVQIQGSEKNPEVFFFFFLYLKEIIRFNDPQPLILEARKVRSRETDDLQEVPQGAQGEGGTQLRRLDFQPSALPTTHGLSSDFI